MLQARICGREPRHEVGNDNTAATQVTVAYDADAPSVEIAGPADAVAGNFTVTITFSEAVTGLAESDLTVTGGAIVAASLAGSGSIFTVNIAPDVVQVSLAADVAEDSAGNGNTASNVFEVQAGSAVSEFEAKKDDIRRIIREDARRMLERAVAFNQNHVRSARDRLRASQDRQQAKPPAAPMCPLMCRVASRPTELPFPPKAASTDRPAAPMARLGV